MPVATHSEGPYPVVTQALVGSWAVTGRDGRDGRDGLKISGSSLVVLVL
jgi:hypothetical protein